jgi:2-dehydro-3-deoxygluconokinase
MKTVVTFGEVMLRLSPPDCQRFVQARSLDMTFGGAEANVAASLAAFGVPVEYVTRLPANEFGETCLRFLREHGIGTRHIARGGDRLGIYFLEMGSSYRASQVVYDRAGSALATMRRGMVDWQAAFAGADWFHWTGITPAVSAGAAEACAEAVQKARTLGLNVSCDLNYRSKLWKWGKAAGEVMTDLVKLCDVAVANEEDAEQVFGIKAPEADVAAGKVEAAAYAYVCNEMARRFPNLRRIAITLRGSLSASHNTWSAVLWEEGRMHDAPVYDIAPIVDRLGAGDSFTAGLIYGLRAYRDTKQALDFAAAASCLKHTIWGDFNAVTVAEVEKLMKGDVSGRVKR